MPVKKLKKAKSPSLPKGKRPGSAKPKGTTCDLDAVLTKGSKPKPLEPKEEAFVREYVIDLNGARAARRAGYSPVNARCTASDLLAKANIRQAVEDALGKAVAKSQLNVQAIIDTILAHIDFDPGDLVDPETGQFIPVEDLPERTRKAVLKWEILLKNVEAGDKHIDRVLKIQHEAKLGWVELGAKYLGMLVEKVEVVNHEKNLAALEAGRQRVAAMKKQRDAAKQAKEGK